MLFSSAASPTCVSSCATSQATSSGDRMPASMLRRAKKRSNRTSGIRWTKGVSALAVLCLSALGLFAPSAEAQTAHFSWAMSTLGSGFSLPQGVAVDASGNLFIADNGNNAVKEIVAAGGTVTTLAGSFVQPTSVSLDASGNVFVADSQNNAVKEILAAGGYTIVNTLGSGFNQPESVAVDASGNIF